MSLYIESFGGGKPLVMLHGWGMHGGIWGDVVQQLSQNLRVHCVDLPGHGFSKIPDQDSSLSVDVIVDELSAQFEEPVNVCGWSLGGQIALRWAQRYPAQIEKLVLAASTPCFVQCEDWQCAVAEEVLEAFADAMEQDYQGALKRFLALQVRGSENERDLLQTLRARLFERGEPDIGALYAGLGMLLDTDLRTQLELIEQPALVIAGARDTLTPLAALEYMAQALPRGRLVSIAGAAHAPFLSHPEIFVEQVADFLHE